MIGHRSLMLVIVLAFCVCSAPAQQPNEPNAELRDKAFKVIESVAGELGTLQSPENRARLGANVFDSLWDHDEKRARALLPLIEDGIKAGLQNADSRDPKDQHAVLVFFKLRADTVERLAKHDGELAFAFFKATQISSDKRLSYYLAGQERNLELSLARQIATQSPELALQVGRKALAHGLADDVLLLLRRLSRKQKEHALVFYKEILAQLKNSDLNAWPTRAFVQNLVTSYRPPVADESTFRELTNLLMTEALARGCGKKLDGENEEVEFCRWMGSIVPAIAEYDPARSARLKYWVGGEQGWERRSSEGYSELVDTAEDGTVDEYLALAEKYPQLQDEFYSRAAWTAKTSGDLERARKIAGYISNSSRQQGMLAQIEADQKSTSMDEQQLADVQKRAREIARAEQQVSFLLSVANAVNQKAGLKLLDQASEIVETMKPGAEQTRFQIAVATIYCLQKSDRGLDNMESLVPKLNDLVDAAVKLDGYDTDYLREGEWNMSANGSTGELLTGLAQNAGYFAWCDFDRAITLAGRFGRPEIRLMAQLKLAQGILAGPPRRILVDYSHRF